jgi:inner membrane transporter RhtA
VSRERALAGAGFVLAGAALIQWAATLMPPVFAGIGPSAASAWRFALGAVVLLAATRPRLRHWRAPQWRAVVVMGVATAFMNQCFYQAFARIPLGSAVAIEYLGPFLVAALSKRSWRHLAFVGLAGAGVVALARPGGGITLVGGLFALGSGAGWAAYAFASARVGAAAPGFSGLAMSMSVAAVVTLPFSAPRTSALFSHPALLGRVTLAGFMAVALGFGAELQALRRLRPAVVSVLLALDPAVAFFFGWALLHQAVTGADLVGLACVVVAGVGVTVDAATGDLGLAL